LFRLRCYSESNLDEYGWKSMGSSSLSQTRIMEVEEGEEEEGHREADIRFFLNFTEPFGVRILVIRNLHLLSRTF
jgi:hypothetical protein